MLLRKQLLSEPQLSRYQFAQFKDAFWPVRDAQLWPIGGRSPPDLGRVKTRSSFCVGTILSILKQKNQKHRTYMPGNRTLLAAIFGWRTFSHGLDPLPPMANGRYGDSGVPGIITLPTVALAQSAAFDALVWRE